MTWRDLAEERLRQVELGYRLPSAPGYKGPSLEPWPSDDDLSARARALSGELDMTPGDFHPSPLPMALAIQGDGFFVLAKADGETVYTRRGDFVWTDNVLRSHDGYAVQVYPIEADGQTAKTATDLRIKSELAAKPFEKPDKGWEVDPLGRIVEWRTVTRPNGGQPHKQRRPIAQFVIATFSHPQRLGRADTFNFSPLAAAGATQWARPVPGQIRAGHLEEGHHRPLYGGNAPATERMHLRQVSEATVRVAGQLPESLSRSLSQRGLNTVWSDPLTLVEARSPGHFLHAGADVLAQAQLSAQEAFLLREMMVKVVPALIMVNDRPDLQVPASAEPGWSEVARVRLEILFQDMRQQSHPGFKARIPAPWPAKGDPTGTRSELPTTLNVEQGQIFRTTTATHMAIQGDGFFVLRRPDGSTAYSRGGIFALRDGHTLADKDGNMPLFVPLETPGSAQPYSPQTNLYREQYNRLHVDDKGTLSGMIVQTDPVTGQEFRQVVPLAVTVVATFPSPQHLSGDGLLLWPSAASGEPRQATALEVKDTKVLGGHLELSNVDFMTIGAMIGQEKERAEQVNAATVTCLGGPDPAFRARLEKHGLAVVAKGRLTLIEARSPDEFLRAGLRLLSEEGLTESQRQLAEKFMLALRPGIVLPVSTR